MEIRTVELFAGVGGFRLGLERSGPAFRTVWWNQWEPRAKAQHAWSCYVQRFHGGRPDEAPPASNQDICAVPASEVPDHDLLVGGFPCQDYSVATTLDKSAGLQGRKGVLWWEIARIAAARRPRWLLLENVDRLLRSPARQRGRDFGVVLACLRDLGYAVEWRVLNAADWGAPQRRRRTFLFAARLDTGIGRRMARLADRPSYLEADGFFAQEFPVRPASAAGAMVPQELPADVREVSRAFAARFHNAGVMAGGRFWTRAVAAVPEAPAPLGPLLETGAVEERHFVPEDRLPDWQRAKGAKREPRTAKNGWTYLYSEGQMQFPDLPDAPARTILTTEANRSPNRSTHVVPDPASGRLRFLLPTEVERLMGFPDGWTASLPERWRYFTMGNALVVPLVTRMGNRLQAWIAAHEPPAAASRARLRESRPTLVAPTPAVMAPRRRRAS